MADKDKGAGAYGTRHLMEEQMRKDRSGVFEKSSGPAPANKARKASPRNKAAAPRRRKKAAASVKKPA